MEEVLLEEDQDYDEHEWEYMEEALADARQRESEERYKRMPELCQRCRWLEWYHLEDCSWHMLPIVNGECPKYCRDYKFVFRLPACVRYLWWNVQYKVWSLRQWLSRRKD